jgi:hypothetical protein
MFLTTFLLGTFTFSQNEYEKMFIGKWEVPEDPNLFVFEENNIVYIEDIDGIRVTENGRWRATSDKVSIELKYNGKRYRMVYEYEFIDEDTVDITIVKALEDGKPIQDKEFKINETYTMTRWNTEEGTSNNNMNND